MEGRKQILAVDDTAISLAAIERALNGVYDVVTVNSGIRAIRYLINEKPDLILLDINMANKDGVETLREIRKMKNGYDIPVIMLTGVQDKQAVLESSKLGVAGYVLKPFDHDDLRSRIRSVFMKQQEQTEKSESMIKGTGEAESENGETDPAI